MEPRGGLSSSPPAAPRTRRSRLSPPGVRDDIFAIVFGESVLNDAVAIVLFRTVNRFTKPGAEFNAGSFFYAVGEFFWISAGSVGIGFGFGFIMCMMSKWLHLKGDLPTLWLLMLAYISYICAELATLSGIMTVLTYGIFVGHYAYWNMDDGNRDTSIAISRILGVTFEVRLGPSTCLVSHTG